MIDPPRIANLLSAGQHNLNYSVRKRKIKWIKWKVKAENLRSTLSARCSPFVFFLSARCSPSVFSEVLAARKKNLTAARARKSKHNPRMLAHARKNHSIPLPVTEDIKWKSSLQTQLFFTNQEFAHVRKGHEFSDDLCLNHFRGFPRPRPPCLAPAST